MLTHAFRVDRWRKADRPELPNAFHLAKVRCSTFVVAKLERLARNAAFAHAPMDGRMRFLPVDMPADNGMAVGIMALVAQQEREAISRRTKEALAVAKARGVKVGNPNGATALRRARKGDAAPRVQVSANADAFAANLAAVTADIGAAGHVSLWAIAAELAARGIRTRRGGAWRVSNVQGLIGRVHRLGLAGHCALRAAV